MSGKRPRGEKVALFGDFPNFPDTEAFDPKYMSQLYELGLKLGQAAPNEKKRRRGWACNEVRPPLTAHG